MKSVHDNEIVSYEVNLKEKRIKLNTVIRNTEEKIEVRFSNVIAHVFEEELPGSIILDIEESNLEKFFKSNQKLLQEKKDYFWPMIYKTESEFHEKLKNENISYFIIFSSYGLNGWILAENMDIEAK